MKVYLETMGCQMNQLDSELVISALRSAGHEMTDDARQANVLLYNTCSVRRQAENKVYSRLGQQAQRKAAGCNIIVGVLGCMAQREGQELFKKYPVDLVCSPGQLDALPAMIAEASAGRQAVRLDPQRSEPRDAAADARLEELDLSRDATLGASSAQAYVRVSRGCDKFCSYCIVPFVRGGEASRNPHHVVEEVKRLVDAGRSEITLLGQTVNSYRYTNGQDTPPSERRMGAAPRRTVHVDAPGGMAAAVCRHVGAAVRFSDLLALVSAVPGVRRLRFVTSHPIDFGDDILQAMRDLPNICRYIHVPAQSGSDAVLARMNRKYTRAQYDDLIDRARAIVPDVVLAGDFIVGFPGETEADHAASADLIRRSGYKNSFIFKYSPRPGTAAARRFKDDVPMAVKRLRNNDLLAVQAQVGLAHHQGYIGRSLEVLVEGPSARDGKQPAPAAPGQVQLAGRTRGDHIVVFDGPPSLAGQYVDVQIAGATGLTLFGKA